MAFEDAQRFLSENSVPEGFESVVEKKQKPAGVTAKFEQNEAGDFVGTASQDSDQYSTFTAAPGETGVKNPYNRSVHLKCEFGNPNGAHSESGKATHLIYLNGGPTMDPLEVPMAACAHHEVKIREKAAQMQPEVHPYFRPILNRRMIAEHRARVDKIKKEVTMSLEGGLRKAGVQEGTAEALWGRETPNFYVRGIVPPTSNPELDEVKKRRGNVKMYRLRGGKHEGKLVFLNPDVVEEGGTALENVLQGTLNKSSPEGFQSVRPNRPPGEYFFRKRSKSIEPIAGGTDLPIENRGTKQKVAHVMSIYKHFYDNARKENVSHDDAHASAIEIAMPEAHRLNVHSEVESLMSTHMRPYTTTTDDEGVVTVKPGRGPQRSKGTVTIGTLGQVAAQLPADKAELDLTTGEYRALTPIEAYTEGKFEDTLEQADIEARQKQTAEKLRAIEARKQRRATRKNRPALPGGTLKDELDRGTGNS